MEVTLLFDIINGSPTGLTKAFFAISCAIIGSRTQPISPPRRPEALSSEFCAASCAKGTVLARFIIESALRFVASGVASCNGIRLSFTESEAILVSTIFAILNVLPINIGP